MFYLSIILIVIGVILCFKGDASLFSPQTGGGSRIPPDAQVRLNSAVQQVAGHKEEAHTYFLKSNIFRPNVVGMILLAVGIVLLLLTYFI